MGIKEKRPRLRMINLLRIKDVLQRGSADVEEQDGHGRGLAGGHAGPTSTPEHAATLPPRRPIGKHPTSLVPPCHRYLYSDYLTDPPEPLSLRLQASLLVGVCRIYGQQYGAYCGMVEGFWRDLCGGVQPRLEQSELLTTAIAPTTKKRKSIEQVGTL